MLVGTKPREMSGKVFKSDPDRAFGRESRSLKACYERYEVSRMAPMRVLHSARRSAARKWGQPHVWTEQVILCRLVSRTLYILKVVSHNGDTTRCLQSPTDF